jgi:hypothetical protein
MEKKFQKDPVSFFNAQGGGGRAGWRWWRTWTFFDPKQQQERQKRWKLKSKAEIIQLS